MLSAMGPHSSTTAPIFPAIAFSLVFTIAFASSSQTTAAEGARERPFYTKKMVRILVGFERGVAYDLYARLTADYFGRHIPGRPLVIVQNRPEVGTKTAESIYGAPPNGTALAALTPALYFQQLITPDQAGYDWAKLTWIGSPTKSHYLLYMRTDAPYKTLQDISASSVPAVCGSGDEVTTGYYLPKLLEETLGAKFKIVTGFKRGPDVDLAVERGELQCRALTIDGFFSHEPYPTWLKTGFIRVLLQTGTKRDPRLPDVSTLNELMEQHKTSDSSRRLAKLILASSEFGRPVVGPPGMPADRVKILRDGYRDTMKDPGLIAEAKKGNLELNPATGEELETLAKEVVAQPPDIIERMQKLLKSK